MRALFALACIACEKIGTIPGISNKHKHCLIEPTIVVQQSRTVAGGTCIKVAAKCREYKHTGMK